MKIYIETKEENTRLDKFLKEKHNIPFSLIQKLVRKKDIKVNGKKTTHNYILKNGDEISIYHLALQERETSEPNKALYEKLLETIKSNIVFKDKNIIAINKPFDVAVQGGTKIKISISDILPGLVEESEEAPRIVHRLDKHTSGLLILARTKEVAQILMTHFQDKTIEKTYIALVAGKVSKKSGTLKSFLSKNTSGDYEKVSSSADGKEAVTNYKVLETYKNNVSLIEFTPLTGRMHQIRVHASEMLDAPILGDTKYGGTKSIITTLQHKRKLHLAAVSIKIKELKGKDYNIECPAPAHIHQTIDQLSV